MTSVSGLRPDEQLIGANKSADAPLKPVDAPVASTATPSGRTPIEIASQKHHGAVLAFSGSLGELVKLCRKVSAGTTVDLCEACVEEQGSSTLVSSVDTAATSALANEIKSSSKDDPAPLSLEEGGRAMTSSLRAALASTESRSIALGEASHTSTSAKRTRRRGAEGDPGASAPPLAPLGIATIAGTPEHGVHADGCGPAFDPEEELCTVTEKLVIGQRASAALDQLRSSSMRAAASESPEHADAAGEGGSDAKAQWTLAGNALTPLAPGVLHLRTTSDSELVVSTPADAYVRRGPVPRDGTHSPRFQLPAASVTDALDLDAHTPPFTLLRGRGVTLRNGSIRLPAGRMLLVEGDVALHGVSVVGGGAADPATLKSAPLVFVSQGTVSMEGVTVGGNQQGHGVGVGMRGTLELRDCELSNNHSSGLVVRGTTAAVTARRCRFDQNGQDGARVSEGASATFEDCEFARNHGIGLGVGHVATVVCASACTAERNGYGYVAHSGADVRFEGCRASNNAHGVHATDAATKAHVSGGAFASNREGLHVSQGAEMTLQGVKVTANTVGCCATETGTLAIDDCSVSHSASHGVRALSGGVVRLCGGTVERNEAHGVLVEHSHSELSAEDVRIRHNTKSGVSISLMACAKLRGCELTHNKVAGLHAATEQTFVDMADCQLDSNGTIGMFLNKGATGTIRGGTIRNNGSSGCEVRDRHSVLRATRTAIAHNGRVGVYVHSAATATYRQCSIRAGEACTVLCGGREGVDLGGGSVALRDCEVEESAHNVLRHGGRIFEGDAAACGTAASGSEGSGSEDAARQSE